MASKPYIPNEAEVFLSAKTQLKEPLTFKTVKDMYDAGILNPDVWYVVKDHACYGKLEDLIKSAAP